MPCRVNHVGISCYSIIDISVPPFSFGSSSFSLFIDTHRHFCSLIISSISYQFMLDHFTSCWIISFHAGSFHFMLDNFISCSISFDTALIVMLFVCLLILILRQLAESKHFKSIGLHSCAHTHTPRIGQSPSSHSRAGRCGQESGAVFYIQLD